jgi:hypothetical protein
MRKNNPSLASVILPFIGGQNLTSSVAIEPDRWVIFFRDWSLDYCKKNYSEALDLLEVRFSQNLDDAPKRKNWWQFHRHRAVIYDAMENMQSVLIRPYTSNMCWFEFGRNDWVYSNAVIVVLSDEEAMWGVLNSSIHELHTYSYSTRMKTDIRYIPSACFGFFPLPDKLKLEVIDSAAKRYAESRKNVRLSKNCNLRELYQNFHNHKINDEAIVNLRQMHIDLDKSVAEAYGWPDISLNHGFHETTQGLRFTLSESARVDVLRRLLELNHQRYKEEVARGLHGNAGARAPHRAARAAQEQPSLDFDAVDTTTAYGGALGTAILAFLCTHDGWHAKADVLAAVGITDGQWNAAIADLISGGKVERRGEKRSARYRIQIGGAL